jgi:hypothetical protein
MFKEKIEAATMAVFAEAREYLASLIVSNGGTIKYEFTLEVDDRIYFQYDEVTIKDSNFYAVTSADATEKHDDYMLYNMDICEIADDFYNK